MKTIQDVRMTRFKRLWCALFGHDWWWEHYPSDDPCPRCGVEP